MIIFATSSFLFYNCSSGKKTLSKGYVNPSNASAGKVTSYDEPTYKLDRRLAATMVDSTDNTGAVGPGTGASYASYSYRSLAYKNAKARSAARTSSLATYQRK